MQVVIIVAIVALIIVGAIMGHIAAQKRREAMFALAHRLGLRFDQSKDRDLARRFQFLDKLRQGSNRYAFNTLSGSYQDHDVTAFDYHYETHSSDSKGRRQTHHHYFSFFVLRLPTTFPELTIGPEGFFSKIAQAVGYDDIDFESHEFSRKFCVRSKDKKFAYDVCNARMIEYLLANPDLVIEIELDSLAIAFNRRLKPEQIEPNLQRLVAVRSLMPDYLFARS
ncbi:MAG: hypothetical protein JSW27_16625 [Phycisphaerales bacterium]|nr:MAG: hypothetical protein JSW27_16625 [Phycisphaerales bacterium]